MRVSNLKGLATDRAPRARDAVIGGTSAPTARQQSFQDKLALADDRHRHPGVVARNNAPGAHVTEPRTVSSRTAAAANPVSPVMTPTKSVATRGADDARQLAALSSAARNRLRRFRKKTPRKLRDRIFRLTTDLGLSVVDVWSDASAHSVILVVDQPGYSTTRLVIECQGAVWQVGIRATEDGDTQSLLTQEKELQRRFSRASLGHVVVADLSLPGQRPTDPATRASPCTGRDS